MSRRSFHTLVIGAGFGGLATALRLIGAGHKVTVLEMAGAAGGKARAVPSAAGPVDAGPTVLTMRWVFDDLLAAIGARMEDHVTLTQEPVIARHWWPDGSSLDLYSDPDASTDAINDFAGSHDASAFRAFRAETETVFNAFRGPMMESSEPNLRILARAALSNPEILPTLLPWSTMAKRLSGRFKDHRLQQLFGRYSTYVGGSPFSSPALLSLIWHAEELGVWRVEGGIHQLARAIARIAEDHGAEFAFNSKVVRIEQQGGRATAAVTSGGKRLTADAIVFGGDPRALSLGLLGDGVRLAVPDRSVEPRSLSARVWSFAARPGGSHLLHHNVFFGEDAKTEFDPISTGKPPSDPTLYVCAEDRGMDKSPPPLERFEIIENAAPVGGETEDVTSCRTRVFQTLARRGLMFEPIPPVTALTGPEEFEELFPGSAGSLYGRSPHGMMASLARPRARTKIPGLYLAGGGVHPGAGVPMATLSGKHAAEAILKDQTSTSRSRPTVMPGGTWTGSRPTAAGPSRSSPS